MNANNEIAVTPACGDDIPQAETSPWLKLIAGIALILIFIFGFGNLVRFLPGVKRMGEVIDERNLRATAIYYTDFEESAEASESIRDSLEYGPGRNR
ncbi:MAG: hypothetical protein A2V65_10880, partial [Deltaproteobacteria bacterium RBG_13_49_15]